MTKISKLFIIFFSFQIISSGCSNGHNNKDTTETEEDLIENEPAEIESDGDADADLEFTDKFYADYDFIDSMDITEEEETPEVIIIHCADLPHPASGTCDATEGSDAILIRGNILTGDRILEGGEVLINATGTISCVECDCSLEPQAADATTLNCGGAIISPGFINPHDHLTYTQNSPGTWGSERFNHRHDWRLGLRGHTRLYYSGGASNAEMVWGELRQVMGGTTSIAGSGGAAGFLRNVDKGDLEEGLNQNPVLYRTFPLGDSNGTMLTSNCAYPSIDQPSVLFSDCYLPHVSEGIDNEARNEFLCLSSTDRGGVDLTEENSTFIHAIGLNSVDGNLLATEGTAVVWSPRTNISLYGNTTPVTMYHRQGVLIALGTDWTVSGSINMLRELACASFLNDYYFNHTFEDRELWLMATEWAAQALHIDDATGSIRQRLAGDIAIFDGRGRSDYYRAIIESSVADVALVLRGGQPLYGDPNIVSAIPSGKSGCEEIPGGVCSKPKRVCVFRETGMTFSQLMTENTESYGLFFCDTPENEPTCIPMRPGEYSGEITSDDSDGDGIPNAIDNCPNIFNPPRPVDNFEQADADGDGVGDACDPCPLNPDTTTCTTPNPDDRDGDTIPNSSDNCPGDPNPGQEDTDGDGKGDACDECPLDPNPGNSACPASIYDVKQGIIPVGRVVQISGVVTGVSTPRFFMQIPEVEQDTVLGARFSGIYIYVPSSNPLGLQIPQEGDMVNVTGTIQNWYGQIQISNVTSIVILSHSNPLPPPVFANPCEVSTGGTLSQDYEGVLVNVRSATVTALNPPAGPGDTNPTNEYVLNNCLRVNDFFYLTNPFPQVGDVLTVTGILRYANNDSKLEPRRARDILFETASEPALRSFEPQLVYIDEGVMNSLTNPPLEVTLMRPAPEGGVAVELQSIAPGNLTVASPLIIPQNSTSSQVIASGISGLNDPITVYATLGSVTLESHVVVIASGRVPAPVSITPDTGSVITGMSLDLTVTLDIPARPGGTTAEVYVSDSSILSAPSSITFAEGTLQGTLTVRGLITGGPVTVTVSTTAGSAQAQLEVIDRPPTPFFSEYVEGSSYNKAVEIFNGSTSPLDLSTCLINLYSNGSTSPSVISLDNITLPQGSVYVVCHSSISNPSACNLLTSRLTHNGNDALELVCSGNTIDVIGQIGVNPVSGSWGSEPVTTINHTLRRKCTITAGDTNGYDPFDPSLEWDSFPQDTLDGLGFHCP